MAYDEAFENDSATDIDSPRSGGDNAYDSSELQQVSDGRLLDSRIAFKKEMWSVCSCNLDIYVVIGKYR